jgi:hypothetical protein
VPADKAVDLVVHGGEQLEKVARRLKEIGDKELRKELFSGIQRAAKPMKLAAQQAARSKLPRRGGLNEWVASSKFTVSVRSGKFPAARVTGKKSGHDLAALNRGRLRHPLYGDRGHWYTQQIDANWFSDAMAAQAPAVREEIVAILDDIARRIGA